MEDLISENTRLVMEYAKFSELNSEKEFLIETLDQMKSKNKVLKEEVSDLKHKLQVSQTLRTQFKDFAKQHMDLYDYTEFKKENAHLLT